MSGGGGGGGKTPTSEVKKGRLEALERRHAQTSSNKTPSIKTPFCSKIRTPSSKIPSSKTPGRRSSLQSSNAGSTSETVPVIYAPLGQTILNGELGTQLKLDSEQNDVRSMLRQVWGENKDGAMEKINNNVYFLDNPEKARLKSQQGSKRSSKHLSLGEHRKLGSFRLDRRYMKYELYSPMHSMWCEYINSLISGCNDAVLHSRLLTSELHGASLEVIDSSNKSFIGIKGIMIRETENTFGIITRANKFSVVPKAGSIFMLQVDNLRVTLFGNNLASRSLQTQNPAKKLKPTIEGTKKIY